MLNKFSVLRGMMLAGVALGVWPCLAADAAPSNRPSAVRDDADRLAAALVAKMTLDEKVAQLVNVAG